MVVGRSVRVLSVCLVWSGLVDDMSCCCCCPPVSYDTQYFFFFFFVVIVVVVVVVVICFWLDGWMEWMYVSMTLGWVLTCLCVVGQSGIYLCSNVWREIVDDLVVYFLVTLFVGSLCCACLLGASMLGCGMDGFGWVGGMVRGSESK